MEKKVYEKKIDKVIDFLIGFLLIPAFFGITTGFVSNVAGYRNLRPLIPVSVLVAELLGAIYLCRKRKYIGIGLLFALVVVPLVFLGTCLLIMGGRNIIGLLFRR